MDLVNYLVDIYGYDTPIFIKDVRIGRKSKTAIREEFYRESKNGRLEKKSRGVYCVRSQKEFGSGITFSQILEKKYLYSKNAPYGFEKLFVEGYYSGLTFLNMIGLSNQVPAMPEITTNRTSSKKRYYVSGKMVAIIRKSRTTVNSSNCDVLQFLDMFHFLTMEEVKNNRDKIIRYVKEKQLSKHLFTKYLGLYKGQTMKKIVEGGILDAFM